MTYPAWICGDCGERYGRRVPKLATWHIDECGWCHDPVATVTEPRDFGYPAAPLTPMEPR